MASENERYQPAFSGREKPCIAYGIPFEVSCAYHVQHTFHSSKVYIIVSSSMSPGKYFGRLENALTGRIAGVRRGIRPHTPWTDVLLIIREIREREVDLIVTLGAGSLTDGAKIVAYALANDITTEDGLARMSEADSSAMQPCSIPLINIPTSLSGGEYSSFAGGTDTWTNHKMMFKHPSMGADLIILDPNLSISTPRETWLASGMRAIDHCVEGLISNDDLADDASEQHFREGLKLLVPNLLITVDDWDAEEPRMKQMMGVLAAMQGLAKGIPMGGSHGIGHQLGPLGVGHGQTSCILLPAILDYNLKHGDEKVKASLKKVSSMLWDDNVVREHFVKDGLDKGRSLGNMIRTIVQYLRLPRNLGDVGVTEEKFEGLAETSLKGPWLRSNVVPLIDKHQVVEILQMAK